MADLYVDALVRALTIFWVSVSLFYLLFMVVAIVISAVKRAHEKAMAKKKKEVDSDDV